MGQNSNSTPPSDDGTVRADWRQYETPTSAVVNTVASATDRDATELPPLYESVDTDSLGVLLRTGDEGTRVSFPYEGLRVVLDAEGTIAVRPGD